MVHLLSAVTVALVYLILFQVARSLMLVVVVVELTLVAVEHLAAELVA
jgi:hypothetical protein